MKLDDLRTDLDELVVRAENYHAKAKSSANICHLSDAMTMYLMVANVRRSIPAFQDPLLQDVARETDRKIGAIEHNTWGDILSAMQSKCACRITE